MFDADTARSVTEMKYRGNIKLSEREIQNAFNLIVEDTLASLVANTMKDISMENYHAYLTQMKNHFIFEQPKVKYYMNLISMVNQYISYPKNANLVVDKYIDEIGAYLTPQNTIRINTLDSAIKDVVDEAIKQRTDYFILDDSSSKEIISRSLNIINYIYWDYKYNFLTQNFINDSESLGITFSPTTIFDLQHNKIDMSDFLTNSKHDDRENVPYVKIRLKSLKFSLEKRQEKIKEYTYISYKVSWK